MKVQRSGGLKGQQADSPGQRPGWMSEGKYALKGQKHYLCGRLATIGDAFVAKRRKNAFALAGRWLRSPFIPRVLPWADCSLAFQAALRKLSN